MSVFKPGSKFMCNCYFCRESRGEEVRSIGIEREIPEFNYLCSMCRKTYDKCACEKECPLCNEKFDGFIAFTKHLCQPMKDMVERFKEEERRAVVLPLQIYEAAVKLDEDWPVLFTGVGEAWHVSMMSAAPQLSPSSSNEVLQQAPLGTLEKIAEEMRIAVAQSDEVIAGHINTAETAARNRNYNGVAAAGRLMTATADGAAQKTAWWTRVQTEINRRKGVR